MLSRSIRKIVALGVLMPALAFAGSVGVSASAKSHVVHYPGTITAAWLGNGSAIFLPLELGADQGIFAKYGLNVNPQIIAAAATTAALESGAAQFSIISPPQDDLAYQAGVPIQLLGEWSYHEPLYLIAAPGITKVSDLIGKPVTLSSPTALTTIFEEYVLHLNGIKPSQVTFVAAPNVSYFIAGQTDATVGSILNVHLTEQGRPGSSVLYNFEHLLWPSSEVFGFTPWTSTHKAETVAFLKALNASVVLWNKSPTDAENEILKFNVGISQNTAAIDYESTEQVFNKGPVPLHAPSYRIETYINKVLRLVGISTAVNAYSYEGKVWTSKFWNLAFGKS